MKKVVQHVLLIGGATVVALVLLTNVPLSTAILGAIERQIAEPLFLPAVAGLSFLSGTITRHIQMQRRRRCDELREQMKATYRKILEAYCEGGAR